MIKFRESHKSDRLCHTSHNPVSVMVSLLYLRMPIPLFETPSTLEVPNLPFCVPDYCNKSPPLRRGLLTSMDLHGPPWTSSLCQGQMMIATFCLSYEDAINMYEVMSLNGAPEVKLRACFYLPFFSTLS